MSLKIGGSASKSSQTSNTNSTSSFNNTSMPIVPDWASSLTQNVAGKVGQLSQANPYGFIAPSNDLQQLASSEGGYLNGSPSNFNAAVGETGYIMNANAPHTGAVQASPYIQAYMDPYQSDVVDAADADLAANEGHVRAQQALDLAGSGAFGGSGAALTQSMTEGELARARVSTLAGLRSQGFTQALGAAQQDAQRAQGAKDLNAQLYGQQMDRSLAAARQLGDLSAAYDANQRANIGTQLQAGDDLRNIQQQKLQAPVTSTQQIVAMLSGLPIQLFTGQTQSGTQTGSSTTNASAHGTNISLGAEATNSKLS